MKTIYIMTGFNCNLRCTYCYENLDNTKITDIEKIKEFVLYRLEQEQNHQEQGFAQDELMVDFIGGEPFLNPEMLDEVMQFVLDNAYKFGFRHVFWSFSSNGTLLTTPKCKHILEKYRNGINIGISIDGDKEKHDKYRLTLNGTGSFDKALEGYKYAKSVLPPGRVGIKATFNRSSIKDYARCTKYLLTLEPDYLYSNFVFEEQYDEVDAAQMALELFDVIDYIVKNDIKTTFNNIIENGEFIVKDGVDNVIKPLKYREQTTNPCGSCTHISMQTISTDGKIYGCNRFATSMAKNTDIGSLVDGKFVKNEKFSGRDSLPSYHTMRPEGCNYCPVQLNCADCLAVPYENLKSSKDEIKEWRSRKPHCGWTKAKSLASEYGRILQLNRNLDGGVWHL